jgi:hypothetical protein
LRLLVAIALIIGIAFLAVPYLRPSARNRFVALNIGTYRDPSLPILPWRFQDVDGLRQGEFFHHPGGELPAQITQARLLQELTNLRRLPQSETLVVYLAGYARCDDNGEVQILPADADPYDSATWFSLVRVLDLLRWANAKHRLLILDLVVPYSALLNDIPQCVERDALAVPDPARLILLPHSPGQLSLASDYLGRSVFGHYLDEALRGRGDSNKDGRVMVLELAAFLAHRVDRWTQKTRGERQTPMTIGVADDFPILDLPNGVPRLPREIQEIAYPDPLDRAWAKTGGVVERQRALLAIERDWRRGKDPAQLENDTKTALALTPQAATKAPPFRSLAALPENPAVPDVADRIRILLSRVENQTIGLPAPKANEVRSQAADEWLKQEKATPPTTLTQAIFSVALTEQRSQAILMLDALLVRIEPEPLTIETLAFRQLTFLNHPPETRLRLLGLIQTTERAVAQVRFYPWVRKNLEAALRCQHDSMVLATTPGYSSPQDIGAVVAQGNTLITTVSAELEMLRQTMAVVDRARQVLPPLQVARDRIGLDDGPWLQAANATLALADELESTRTPGIADKIDQLRRQTRELATQLDDLTTNLAPEAYEKLLRTGRGNAADANTWREIDGLSVTSLVSDAQRKATWTTQYELARRLSEDVFRSDRIDDRRAGEPLPVDNAESDIESRVRGAALVAKLRWLVAEPRKELDKLLAKPFSREQVTQIEEFLHTSQRIPLTLDGADSWAWSADWYRYLARDWLALDRNSLAGAFYSRAASDYRVWLKKPREQYVLIDPFGDVPRLEATKPITAQLRIQVSGADKPPGLSGADKAPKATPLPEPQQIGLRLLTPDRDWLQVTPQSIDVLPKTTQTLADESRLVPVQIGLKPGAGESKTPLPKGLLVQVKLNGERTFHHQLDLSIVPRAPDFLITRDPKAPASTDGKPSAAAPLASIRLRSGTRAKPEKTTLYLFLNNPIRKVWPKVAVKLTADDQVRQSEPFKLDAQETRKIVFPVIATPPAAMNNASPMNPAAPPLPPQLPALNGPLELELIDVEKNETITRRRIETDIAAPSEFVAVTGVQYDPRDGRNRLSVQLRLRATMPGGPVTARLRLPALSEGGPSFVSGTREGKLPADGSELTLFVNGLTTTQKNLTFAIDIDGWQRAFLFDATLDSRSPTTPNQVDSPAIRPLIAPQVKASPNLEIPVETDNAPPDAKVIVEIGRETGKSFAAEASQKRDTPRNRYLGFTTGPEGALLFESAMEDWVVGLDTPRTRGNRQLRLRLLRKDGTELAVTTRSIIIGEQSPAGVQFVRPPAKAWKEAPLRLLAQGADPLVGVKEVKFFFGKPKDNKLPPGTETASGVLIDQGLGVWGVNLKVPADKKGPTDISVEFVNKLDLSSFATTTIDLTDTDPALSAPGTIKGTVTEGPAAQADLEVALVNEKGEPKAKTKTNDKGEYLFADLAPGSYRVLATKRLTGRVGGYPRTFAGKKQEFIILAPGATVDAPIVLFKP